MFNKDEIEDIKRDVYYNKIYTDHNEEDIGYLFARVNKAFDSDNFAECRECGVVARKSKMNIEVEPTVENYNDGEPGFGVNETYYCSRCAEEREENREEDLKEKLTEIDGVGDKLAEKIIKILK
ncbi:MAG: hypothetical protein ACOC5T_05800 [Elusimicrobiota bacterium]